MSIEHIKRNLYSAFKALPKEEREDFLDDLLNGLYKDIRENKPFRPTAEQRRVHIKKLAGKTFTHTRQGFSVSFTVTEDGEFIGPDGISCKSPTRPVSVYYSSSTTVTTSANNAWNEAKEDSTGKTIDDYIQDFINNL